MCSFPRWRHLPSMSDEVDTLTFVYTGLQLIAIYWGGLDQPMGCRLVLL
jgi:hypothetical protein